MSRTQFHSIDSFILRHAWLNLWDKRMTTGRINQIAIALRTSFDGFLKTTENHQKKALPSAQRGTTWVDEDHRSSTRHHRLVCSSHSQVPLISCCAPKAHNTPTRPPHGLWKQLSMKRAPEWGTCLDRRSIASPRNNATVTETFLLRAGWLHNQETVRLAAHNFFLAPSRVVSQSRLLNAQSEQPSALAFSGAGIWAVRAYAARSDVEFGFSSSNSTTFPSSEWDTTCRNTTPSTEYFFTSTWLTDLHVARFCGHLRPASTTTVLAHHPTVKASGKRLPAVCVRPPWPTLFEPVDSSTTPIGATSHTRNLTNMDNFETEPTHVQERLLSFVLPLSLLFMKEQGLRATALFFATNLFWLKSTCTHYMYSPLTTCSHYMYSPVLTIMAHVLTTSTYRLYSRTVLGERHRGTCMTCTPSDRFVFHLNNFDMYYGKIRGIVLLKFLVIKMEENLNDQKAIFWI